MNKETKAKIALFESENGRVEFHADIKNDTLWATQAQISELFEVNIPTVNEHLKNIFKTNELKEVSVIRKFRITAKDGKQYLTQFYNLDAILAVGYRVNSKKATKFRIWATGILRDYLIKGFSLNRHILSRSKEKIDGVDEAIEFMRSKLPGGPLKAKVTMRVTKDVSEA